MSFDFATFNTQGVLSISGTDRPTRIIGSGAYSIPYSQSIFVACPIADVTNWWGYAIGVDPNGWKAISPEVDQTPTGVWVFNRYNDVPLFRVLFMGY